MEDNTSISGLIRSVKEMYDIDSSRKIVVNYAKGVGNSPCEFSLNDKPTIQTLDELYKMGGLEQIIIPIDPAKESISDSGIYCPPNKPLKTNRSITHDMVGLSVCYDIEGGKKPILKSIGISLDANNIAMKIDPDKLKHPLGKQEVIQL